MKLIPDDQVLVTAGKKYYFEIDEVVKSYDDDIKYGGTDDFGFVYYFVSRRVNT